MTINYARILCFFRKHEWGRWRNRGPYPIAQPNDERECSRCGHKETRNAKLTPPRPPKKRRAANEADTIQGKR